MATVLIDEWRKNPGAHASALIEIPPVKSKDVSLFVRAFVVSKHLSTFGYKPKVTDRESTEIQMARVIAQGHSTLACSVGSPKELPCSKFLEKVGGKKCKKNDSKDHTSCPVICVLCPQVMGPPIGTKSLVISTRYAYAGHMLSRHNIPPNVVSYGPSPCNCCGFKFANNKSLKIHQKKMRRKPIVEGFSPSIAPGSHMCKLCGHTFLEKSKLTRHVKIHKEEFPISEHISLEMRRSLITIKHKRKNTLVKKERVQCDQCEESYSNSANLRRHKKNVHWEIIDGKYSGSLGPSVTYKVAFMEKKSRKEIGKVKDSSKGSQSKPKLLHRQNVRRFEKKSQKCNDYIKGTQSKTTIPPLHMSDRFEEESVDDVDIAVSESFSGSETLEVVNVNVNPHHITKIAGRDLISEKCGIQLSIPQADVSGNGNCFPTAVETSREPTATSSDLDKRALNLRSTSSKFGLEKIKRGELIFPPLPGFKDRAETEHTLNLFGQDGSWSADCFDFMPNYVSFATGISFLIANLDTKELIPIFPDTHFGSQDYNTVCNLTEVYTAVVVRKSDHFEALQNCEQVGVILQRLREEQGLPPAAVNVGDFSRFSAEEKSGFMCNDDLMEF